MTVTSASYLFNLVLYFSASQSRFTFELACRDFNSGHAVLNVIFYARPGIRSPQNAGIGAYSKASQHVSRYKVLWDRLPQPTNLRLPPIPAFLLSK